MMKKMGLLGLVLVLSVLLSACYLNEEVDADQVGVQMNAGRILDCVGPGVYTSGGWFADLKQISSATVTFNVADPEVATQDNQLVGISITIQARRMTDCDAVRNILTNWPALIADESLINTISATAREGIKTGTRTFTLTGLLDDRNGLADGIRTALEADASVYSVQIINVTIENIALDPAYAGVLQEKALLTAQTETELRRQDLIRQQAANSILEQERRTAVLQEQLIAEQAQTAVQLEIATRAGEVIAAQNAVYINNEFAYELERLRLIQGIIGDRATVYFIPEGTDLTMLWSPNMVVPVDSNDTGVTPP